MGGNAGSRARLVVEIGASRRHVVAYGFDDDRLHRIAFRIDLPGGLARIELPASERLVGMLWRRVFAVLALAALLCTITSFFVPAPAVVPLRMVAAFLALPAALDTFYERMMGKG